MHDEEKTADGPGATAEPWVTHSETDDGRRSLTVEQRVDVSPEEVWEVLTTGPGLERWFPLEAKVEPEESIWLSWGPGSEGRAPIRIWDPPRRFGWTESYGEDEDGRPMEVAVDFHVEGRSGETVVRLVHSGFSTSADWDDMFDAVKDGWRYFLFNLAFYFRHHAGRDRRMVWRRQPTELSREDAWSRLREAELVADGPGEATLRLAGDQPAAGVSARPGYHYAAVLPELGASLWFVELEGRHVGFWLSVYDEDRDDIGVLQTALDDVVPDILAGGG